MLLYLTSWEEQVFDSFTIRRAWKGFRFEALDALEEGGYINQTRRAKSVTLTEAGTERARVLATRYLENTTAPKKPPSRPSPTSTIRLPQALIAAPPLELWPEVVARAPILKDVEQAPIRAVEGTEMMTTCAA